MASGACKRPTVTPRDWQLAVDFYRPAVTARGLVQPSRAVTIRNSRDYKGLPVTAETYERLMETARDLQ